MKPVGIILLIIPITVLCIKAPKVGIIGGGIGGTAAAYYLRTLFGSEIDLTVFEANVVGGRLATTSIQGEEYELGGAVFLDRNQYVHSFLKQFGLQPRKSSSHYSSLYNGHDIVFEESEWKAVTAFNIFWRYGWGFMSLNRHISNMLDKFDRVYNLQDELEAYENVTSLLAVMDNSFKENLRITAEDGLLAEGIPSNIIDELVAATLRVNYGQHLTVHKFVGSVSVAGAGSGLLAVHGGNKMIPEKLLKVSGARLIMNQVLSVTRTEKGTYLLRTPHRGDMPADNAHLHEYDAVIIATPQTEDMRYLIKFENIDAQFGGRYHRTVVTLIRGELNRSYFPKLKNYTDEILTTTVSPFFNSISRIDSVSFDPKMNHYPKVWKIFSQKPLTDEELGLLFESINEKSVTDWLAYPHYNTVPRNDQFLLAPYLYHINAIEWAASAMEMSLIGARNCANLFRRDWCAENTCDQIFSSNSRERYTNEL